MLVIVVAVVVVVVFVSLAVFVVDGPLRVKMVGEAIGHTWLVVRITIAC